jgi:SLT domain-containing protein
MNQESGGNPTIVNTTDSNWFAGTPSVGLMQVIGPTYASHRDPRYDVGPYEYGTSVNPRANIDASIRYAVAAYGDLHTAYDRAGGYDSGGVLPPGKTLVNNATGKPEAVLNADQWDKVSNGSNITWTGDIRIDASSVKEFNDVIKILHDLPQAVRAQTGRSH